MAIANFIPEIWSAAVAQALQDTAVIAPITNTQYEGDARRGNQVNITGIVVPTIDDYAAAGRTTSAEDLSDVGDSLLIDQEKSFDFHVDDIDRVQAAGSFDGWTTAAGRALGEDADEYILAQAVAGGTNDTVALGGATALNDDEGGGLTWNAIRDLRKAMNKAKVPASERFLVLNAEAEARLLDNDAKLTAADTSGSPAGLREATLGRILGFTVVTSNLTPVSDFPQMIAFWRPALAYVSQIDEIEGMRSHTKFADRVRGLHVYGAKVVSMYATAVRYFTGAAA
jgi:hypothetical protein